MCEIDGNGVVTFKVNGDCELLYDQPGNDFYAPAPGAVTSASAPDPVASVVPGEDGGGTGGELSSEAVSDGGAAEETVSSPVPTDVPSGQGPSAPAGLLLLGVGIALAGAALLRREVLATIR